MKYIILLLLVCVIIFFLRHYLYGWRKKCYYCENKITSESNANFSWIIDGSSAAVCDSCEEHAREQAYGSKKFD